MTRQRVAVVAGLVLICVVAMMFFGTSQPTRADVSTQYDNLHVPSPNWQDQIIYFIMTDRFNDGDPSNNDQGFGEYDPTDSRKYNGGDLQGIIDQIDYIRDLGATAIWITPPVANQWWDPIIDYGGFHGYWGLNFKVVDPHLGTIDTYRALSNALHNNGMYLIQDIVPNHTGNFFGYDGEYNPDDPTQNFYLNTETVPVSAPVQWPFNMNNVNDPDHWEAAIYHWTPPITDFGDMDQLFTYQLSDLDDINTSNPEVREVLKDSYGFWIEEVGVDGFRVDTILYVEHDFWNDFFNGEGGIHATAATTGREDFLAFGEAFVGSDPYDDSGDMRVASFLGTSSAPELPSVLNFPMHFTMNRVFGEGLETAALTYRIQATQDIYPDPTMIPNFIDNHDVARFLSKGSQDGMKQATMFMLTSPGIPIIYYGTEQGFTETRAAMFAEGWASGGEDHFNTDSEMYQHLQLMTTIRRENPVFSRGDIEVLADDADSPGVFAYRRDYEDQTALVIMNTADYPVLLANMQTGLPAGTTLELLAGLKFADDVVVDGNGELTLELDARAGMVFLAGEAIAEVGVSDSLITIDTPVEGEVFSGEVSLTGTVSDGATDLIKLVVDDNLGNAIEFSTDEDGNWEVVLPTDRLAADRDHTLFAYAPETGAISDTYTFSVEASLTGGFSGSVADPADDDIGPMGTYTLPANESFNNQMDILGVEAITVGPNLQVTVIMSEVTDVWAPTNGFDHVLFHVFIDLPNDAGSTVLPLLNAEAPEGFAWDYMGFIEGWNNRFFSAEGADADNYGTSTTPAAEVSADIATSTVTFTFDGTALGNPETYEGTKIYVTTWDWNGPDAQYRALSPEGGEWAFAGGDPETDPFILDDTEVVELTSAEMVPIPRPEVEIDTEEPAETEDTAMAEGAVTVTLVGSLQTQLGCDEDWQPQCEATQLPYDADDDLYYASFDLEAGEYEYKVAINQSWDENYGANAEAGGDNIVLTLEEATTVTFFYSHNTNWVTEDINSIVASLPGSYQDEIGCPGEWVPDCLRSWLQDPDGDGIYTADLSIPPGDYEVKVAYDQGWDVNFGAEGAPGGDNIPFTVEEGFSNISFTFDPDTKLLTLEASEGTFEQPAADDAEEPAEAAPSLVEQPDTVSIPGTFQTQLGCEGDWQPECEATQLVYDPEDDLWYASFALSAGEYEYKAAINNSWDENYGVNAQPGGDNIVLVLEEDAEVTFLYSHATHWITDNVNSLLANVPGNYQDEIGCPGEWAPDCLRSWLQDPDGDGIYVFATSLIPQGNYEAKVAVNQSWTVNYGAGGAQDGPNIQFFVPEDGSYVEFIFDTSTNIMTITADGEVPEAPVGDLTLSKAHWVAEDTIAWDIPRIPNSVYYLYYSPDGSLELVDNERIEGGEFIELRYDRDGLPEDIQAKFPHLRQYLTLRIPEEHLDIVPELLRGQVAVFASYLNIDDEQEVIGATGLQIPGVLDDLYTYDGDLGVTWDGDVPTLRVWAPTATNVRLHLFDDATVEESTILDMDYDADFGVWSIVGEPDWRWKYYLYEVTVYAPSVGEVVTNMVTDPYSFSLSTNSQRSQIIDLNDPTLMPEGWNDYEKPPLESPEDIVLYELHIRDFSVNDPSVPEELRGTYLAFTVPESNGMQHLRALANAGLTHLHLLPSFDIATINEDRSTWAGPTFEELAAYPADSDQQQARIDETRDDDGFNWGYDPYHYTAPEGSYATDPNGAQRVLEYRQMIMALNQSGLRVVMDVVYNHTNSAGQSERSVLDRIVPGYYHRLDDRGFVTTSTCCQNTATEHNMMRKLMVDSVITWSTAYKVDGYRFDLMGHHMLTDMIAVRDELDSLTVEEDGVDGASIYVYGEGWDFGEVAANARGINATQPNIAGTGIGAFNDRLRDAVRGGSPFGGWQDQGYATGLHYYPNGITEGTEEEQLTRLLHFSDQIRIGLAGNLVNYSFVDYTGETVVGTDIDYNNSPAAYTLDPQENIVYISAHDNQTLFDMVQYKMPAEATVAERVRAQNMGISITTMSQGVPFFHAGVDMLRSKSMDRNSYNSGDWFNRLDFTYGTNNWAVGLPPAGDNQNEWPIIEEIFNIEGIAPGPEDIEFTVNHFREMLQIRQSSQLFRLETAEDVINRVNFHNTGPDQVPGLIVMSISDMGDLEDLDSNHDMIVVIFNPTMEEISFTEPGLVDVPLELHPTQVNSHDLVVQTASVEAGTFTVPAQTTAVFVAPQN